MTRGRPSLYTPEIGALICERIALGEAVKEIGRDPAMPCSDTIWVWIQRHKDFADRYAHAKARQMELHAEELLEIVDDKAAAENPAWAKLRVDTRKWLMSKLAAKKYGDRSALDVEVKHSLADMLVQLNQRRQSGDDATLIGEGTGDE